MVGFVFAKVGGDGGWWVRQKTRQATIEFQELQR